MLCFGSYALWTATATAKGGTIQAGDLALTVGSALTTIDVATDITRIEIPLTATQDGDNLAAELCLSIDDLAAYHAGFDARAATWQLLGANNQVIQGPTSFDYPENPIFLQTQGNG